MDEYRKAVQSQLEPNIYKHSLALMACMGGIYDYLAAENRAGDVPKADWLLAGLVHDIDYSEPYKQDHPTKTKEALAKYNLTISDTVDQIIKDHDGRAYPQARSIAGWAIRCADSLTGLIVAVALVYPTKKLADVKLKSILKRFHHEPRFAAGTRREEVALCEQKDGLNIPLEKFIEICFESMKAIASDLGL
jgi:uncharacterized protein